MNYATTCENILNKRQKTAVLGIFAVNYVSLLIFNYTTRISLHSQLLMALLKTIPLFTISFVIWIRLRWTLKCIICYAHVRHEKHRKDETRHLDDSAKPVHLLVVSALRCYFCPIES
jgi:hypothetical protein